MKLYTTTEISALTGQADRTIRSLADEHNIGMIHGGMRLFSPADLKRLKSLKRPRGRPAKKK